MKKVYLIIISLVFISCMFISGCKNSNDVEHNKTKIIDSTSNSIDTKELADNQVVKMRNSHKMNCYKI